MCKHCRCVGHHKYLFKQLVKGRLSLVTEGVVRLHGCAVLCTQGTVMMLGLLQALGIPLCLQQAPGTALPSGIADVGVRVVDVVWCEAHKPVFVDGQSIELQGSRKHLPRVAKGKDLPVVAHHDDVLHAIAVPVIQDGGRVQRALVKGWPAGERGAIHPIQCLVVHLRHCCMHLKQVTVQVEVDTSR